MFSACSCDVASLVSSVWWRALRATSSDERPGGRLGEGWQETRSESTDKGSRVKVSVGRDIWEGLVRAGLWGVGMEELARAEVRKVSW